MMTEQPLLETELVARKDRVYPNLKIKQSVNEMKDSKKRRSKCRRSLQRLLDHSATTIFITLITILVLFGDDLRIIFLPKSYDTLVDSILLGCFIAFLLELILSWIGKEEYPWSFFFWLDVVSLISMIFDVYFVVDFLLGENSFLNIPTDATNVARAGRASRVGTKAGRLIKLMRLIRLIRVAKFYKQTSTHLKKREMATRMKKIHHENFLSNAYAHIARSHNLGEELDEKLRRRANIMINDDSRKASFFRKVQRAKTRQFNLSVTNNMSKPGKSSSISQKESSIPFKTSLQRQKTSNFRQIPEKRFSSGLTS